MAGLLLIAACGASAQVPNLPNPAVRAQELAAYRAGLDNANAAARANNAAGVEQALIALNKARPNTAAWHIETAQRLMQTAEQMARDAKPAVIPALAASALQHLALADTRTTSARVRASAKSLAGYIHERYLANPTAALTAYQSAVQLTPGATRTKEAVERLQRSDEILRGKVGGGQ